MARSNMAIIAVETDTVQLTRLSRSLALLGYQPAEANSAEQAMKLIRGTVFERAAVAAELTWVGQTLIRRLRRLPSMETVIAIGPPDDPEMEAEARTSGADAYLVRPVSVESLAKALLARAWARPAVASHGLDSPSTEGDRMKR